MCDFDASSGVCTAKETCTYKADDCTYTSGLYVDIPPEMQEEMAKANTSEEYLLRGVHMCHTNLSMYPCFCDHF